MDRSTLIIQANSQVKYKRNMGKKQTPDLNAELTFVFVLVKKLVEVAHEQSFEIYLYHTRHIFGIHARSLPGKRKGQKQDSRFSRRS